MLQTIVYILGILITLFIIYKGWETFHVKTDLPKGYGRGKGGDEEDDD